ncbi:MAG: DNA polymerase III subunit delta [Candidatus Nealsonbacteria bacterium]|nr:DNA polymerase III subunit delta [Candidatus Nealsonbacteria bacterium]
MIKFLYGKDTYRSGQKLKDIIEEYKKLHKNRVILNYFDCCSDFEKFKDEFNMVSMFRDKKIAVLTNFFSDSGIEEEILSFLKNKKDLQQKEDLILFCEEEKNKTKKSLFNFLKKYGDFQEFNLLVGQELRGWIKEEFKKYKTEVDSDVLESLVVFIGNNLWQLSNEIKKLALFEIKKSEKRVTKKDFDLLVTSKIEPVIFETIDAISYKNKKRALALLHYHLEKGDSPFYIFSMIKFQFSNLLMVKDLVERRMGFSRLKMHPFVLKKSCQLSERFNLEQLKKIYRKIFQLDLKIKTGKIGPVLAIDILIGEI